MRASMSIRIGVLALWAAMLVTVPGVVLAQEETAVTETETAPGGEDAAAVEGGEEVVEEESFTEALPATIDESQVELETLSPLGFVLEKFAQGGSFMWPLLIASIIGLAVFWALAQVVLAVFPAFAKESLGETNTIVIQGAMACSGIGIILGSLAGYFGGWVDILISRLTEIMICFPLLFFVLVIVSVFETRSMKVSSASSARRDFESTEIGSRPASASGLTFSLLISVFHSPGAPAVR